MGRKTGAVFISSDAESYDKWGQALSSAHDLVQQAVDGASNRGVNQFFVLILPVLVVPDQSLWAVDYNEAGQRSPPQQVDRATLFVGREYPLGGLTQSEIHNQPFGNHHPYGFPELRQ